MATAPSKQSDEQNTSSKKPRRSVLRSLSWKRPSKRTKMDDVENEQEPDFDTIVGDKVDVGRSFDTTASSTRDMSDVDAEDELFEHDNTASSSKKRKKSGVWKAVKRFFSRKSGKGSKSFTAGCSRSPHGQPQRSVSDPNLVHRTGERPELAPLEQVDETQMKTDVSPKKAISHDSLLSELRSKQRKNVGEEETSPRIPVVIPEHSGIDWQASPATSSKQLLPGLNVSHDKIRVAPRDRRAPSRKGVASVRHGGRCIKDDNVIPRSQSVGARVQGSVLLEEPLIQPIGQEMRARQEKLEHELITKHIKEKQRKREEVDQNRQEVEKQKHEREKDEYEQEKLEQQEREQEKLEQEKQKLIEEELEREKLEKQRLEQEKLEQLKLEQLKLEQLKLEQLKREQEKLEIQKLEQEKLKRLKLEQEQLARDKVEQEEIQNQILEDEKREKEKHEKETVYEEKIHQENPKLGPYHVQQTTDFSDLVESLRTSGDCRETYTEERSEVETIEITPAPKPETMEDICEPSTIVTTVSCFDQDINIVEHDGKTEDFNTTKEEGAPAGLDIEINDTPNDQRIEDYPQTANNFVVSSLLTMENSIASATQEMRETDEVRVIELVTEQSEESRSISVSEKDGVSTRNMENMTTKDPQTVKLAADESKINTTVTVQEETSMPLNPSPPATPSSPIRSKRLVIETPEKVYQKPIMEKVQVEEFRTDERSDDIQLEQTPNTHRLTAEGKVKSQDDSNIGVAKLTQAFERSSRSYTISYGERRKPEILPKPKVPSKPQSQTLDRNYRFPVSRNTPGETETSGKKIPRKPSDDAVVVLVEVPGKTVESKKSVSSSPTKKLVPPKPKPLPKPVPKPKVKTNKPNMATETAEEGKENIKKTPSAQSVTNGCVKMSDTQHSEDVNKDTPPDLPSFWARRSIFSPEQKTNNSTSTPVTSEKTKEVTKHSPFIQPKTDTCAVCGSKVYQMEKFKVKDNIVHRSCIKCSVCKRLLSVGNFIMSQNKIYCKPHEPHIAISLTTV